MHMDAYGMQAVHNATLHTWKSCSSKAKAAGAPTPFGPPSPFRTETKPRSPELLLKTSLQIPLELHAKPFLSFRSASAPSPSPHADPQPHGFQQQLGADPAVLHLLLTPAGLNSAQLDLNLL